MPQSDLANLRNESGDYLLVPGSPARSAKIFNGSPWTIKQVILHVQLFDNPGGALIFEENVPHPLDADSTGEPFKTSVFKRENVWPKTEYRRARSLGITGAYGVRQDSK